MAALKALLQGKPIRHPLHPALVHFPIGLFVLSLFFDLAALFAAAGTTVVRGAFYAIVGGVIMALLAAIPGFVDWWDIRSDHPAKRLATYHMALNLFAVALYVVNLFVRLGELDRTQPTILAMAMSVIGVGTIAVSGYLGGKLVYNNGIGSGRHRRDTPTPRETIRVSSSQSGSKDGFVPVAEAGSLRDRETLRVQVGGKVMAVANLNGDFYAFQEFCTHRFGPLSEGAFYDGQVECPWHRSCFDVRTGNVTQGPAKVDLETYEVQVREGKLWVKAG
jgi:uncharacterized membrane protein/nitrite reductase/ring-hydroxylating ferredoxin subunit